MNSRQSFKRIWAVTVISVAVIAVACGGEIEPDFFDSRGATSTVIAGQTQTANAEATATAVTAELNAAATRAAGQIASPVIATSTPIVVPTRARTPRPSRTLPTVRPTIDPDASPTPTPITSISPTPITVPTPGPGNGSDPTPTPTPDPVVSPGELEVFGPSSGTLHHLNTGTHAEEFRAGVDVDAFLATAIFGNPFVSDEKDWTIGIWFRVERSDDTFWTRGFPFPGTRHNGLVLVIESNSRWRLIHRNTVIAPQGRNTTDVELQQGVVNGLVLDRDGENRITIAANGEDGALLVNDQVVAELDLSTLTHSGDVVAIAGFEEDDEFAGSVTEVRQFTVYEAGTAIDAADGPAAIGRLFANDPQIAFDGVSGDFILNADFPVVTPVFSGAWSWEITVEGAEDSLRLSVASDSSVHLVKQTVGEEGEISSATVFNSTLGTVSRFQGLSNSVQLVFLDGRVGMTVGGAMLPRVEIDPDSSYTISVRAFVRGETSTVTPVVRVDSFTLWQPAGAATEDIGS